MHVHARTPAEEQKRRKNELPLTQTVSFKTKLQAQNRLQVPKLVRQQYKLETSEILKVTLNIVGVFGVRESFMAKMYGSGRIRIPDLTLSLLKRNESSLKGCILEVTLEPA